ncbi:MAG: sigma-70 family RNA polymerase sigma factor [Rhodothermales bacterium]|nr:sigma-70 family RNA polymerase sigma factor [Rhodothermales bacterium]
MHETQKRGEARVYAGEAALIERIRSGDRDAFRVLVDAYKDRVAAVVIGMMGPGDEAEDIGQETFIRFYRTIDTFRGDSSVATYLHRIAVNLSLNALKRRQRTRQRLAPAEPEALANMASKEQTDRPVLAAEKRHLVRRAIDQLPPAFRSVIVLRLIEGFSTRETADALDLPLGTVLSRLSRAQSKLRELLLPYLHDDERA